MSIISAKDREISTKIVYYGPGLGGKTTSLQAIHRALKPTLRGQLISLATGVDRTLYFDFLPVTTKVREFTVRVQLYTVPGQVHYNATRKLVLNGADGVVFVADSQRERFHANTESLANLEENLHDQGDSLRELPLVMQFNKRDVPHAVAIDEMKHDLQRYECPCFATTATRGKGVFDALRMIIKLVLENLVRQGSVDFRAATRTPPLGVAAIHEPSATAAPQVPGPAAPEDAAPPAVGSLAELAKVIDNLPSRPLPAVSAPSRQSLDRIAQAIDQHLSPTTRDSSPDLQVVAPTRSLSAIVHVAPACAAIAAVETAIDASDWPGAVIRATEAYHQLAAYIVGSFTQHRGEAAALVASLTDLPGSRVLRFRELEGRAHGGGLTAEDALFALHFLVDLGLRIDELRARLVAPES